MDGFGLAQSLPHQIKVSLWCGDSLARFLLERVEDVQDAREAHRVDGAIGIAVEIIANLQHTTAEAFEGLGAGGVVPELHLEKSLSDLLPDFPRKCPQVLPAGTDEDGRLDRAQ